MNATPGPIIERESNLMRRYHIWEASVRFPLRRLPSRSAPDLSIRLTPQDILDSLNGPEWLFHPDAWDIIEENDLG